MWILVAGWKRAIYVFEHLFISAISPLCTLICLIKYVTTGLSRYENMGHGGDCDVQRLVNDKLSNVDICLAGGVKHFFHNIWDNPNPIDYHIFKMVKTANQLA